VDCQLQAINNGQPCSTLWFFFLISSGCSSSKSHIFFIWSELPLLCCVCDFIKHMCSF